MKQHVLVSDNAVEWIGVVVGLVVIMVFDRSGMPQKWHAAVMWTLCTFGPLVVICRKKWRLWNFWAAWVVCFVAHAIAMWLIFARLFSRIQVLGMLYVIPFAIVELIFVLPVLSSIQRKLGRV